MYITNRSVETTIILSIVTCGIYYYVWMYQTSQEVNNTIGAVSYTHLDVYKRQGKGPPRRRSVAGLRG